MGIPSAWLCESDITGYIGLEQQPINNMDNGEVYVKLIFMNYGSAQVKGWGVHDGPFGLTQNDAMLLNHVHGFVCGMLWDIPEWQITEFRNEVDARLKKLKDAYDQGVMPNEN